MIYLATGSKHKYLSASEKLTPFGISLKLAEVDIAEPQSTDVEFIAETKSKQAFETLNKPVLISDASWSIPALNGFPGPFMHFIDKWFEAKDFMNLMKSKDDRRIILENVVAYRDTHRYKSFSVKRKGVILHEPKGNGVPTDRITTFRKDQKSIAECLNAGLHRFDEDLKDSVWRQFGEWYVEKGLVKN